MNDNLNLLLNDELFSIVTSFYNDIYEDSELVKISVTPQFISFIEYSKKQFKENSSLHELSFSLPAKVQVLNSQFLENIKNNKNFDEDVRKLESYSFVFEEDLLQYNCQWEPINSSNQNSKLFLSVAKTESESLFFKISHSERMNSGTIKKYALNPKQDLIEVILKSV